MIPENLDEVLKRFQNKNYDKTEQEITLSLKEICKNSKEFHEYIDKTEGYTIAYDIELPETLRRQFLAGLIVGVILEKEFKL